MYIMKMTNNIIKNFASLVLVGLLTGCNDFLDRSPQSEITPDVYLTEESQLAAYSNGMYPDVLPSHSDASFGTFGLDVNTDNMAGKSYNNRFVPGQWKVSQTGGDWSFDNIYRCNYFMTEVLPKWNNGELSGNEENIKHYIGEMYFLRAYEYFKKLQSVGDFPIVRTVFPDQMEPLIEASKRAPRNEVARFIISDLDSAIVLLKEKAPDGHKNRISKACAQLVKSRVALFEGTWLKYFKGTAFVPNGEGWPGKTKDYNSNYEYPSGNIDKEIDYFLTQAMDASKAVAESITLVENNGVLRQTVEDPVNPYFDMFGAEDMSGFEEVLLWRQYDKGLGIMHAVVQFASRGNAGVGLTRGMVNSFLMEDGMPIYVSNNYAGDDYIEDVRKNRDSRLWLFLKQPGQINLLYPSSEGTHGAMIEPVPEITNADAGWGYSTGYTISKGLNYDQKHCGNFKSYTGSITFRGVEAYLNYMEASYEKVGYLDDTTKRYWTIIRERAKVSTDFTKTIAATNMSEEAKGDWGAYSAGRLIDPTLYNIRRERRCELMGEALRYMDLKRWRAMDQLITSPYHIEGFKLWGPMQDWYKDDKGNSILVYGLDNSSANVSSPELSKYLRPYEVSSKSLVLNGYTWAMAHYLSPIAIQHFMITSDNNEVEQSPIYQNPGWPMTANTGAEY